VYRCTRAHSPRPPPGPGHSFPDGTRCANSQDEAPRERVARPCHVPGVGQSGFHVGAKAVKEGVTRSRSRSQAAVRRLHHPRRVSAAASSTRRRRRLPLRPPLRRRAPRSGPGGASSSRQRHAVEHTGPSKVEHIGTAGGAPPLVACAAAARPLAAAAGGGYNREACHGRHSKHHAGHLHLGPGRYCLRRHRHEV